MTRSGPVSRTSAAASGSWPLQDAKTHFSQLVRLAHRDGPQHVSVHGRESVVVMAVEEYRRLRGAESGAALVAAMQASPCRDFDIEPERVPLTKVRAVDL